MPLDTTLLIVSIMMMAGIFVVRWLFRKLRDNGTL